MLREDKDAPISNKHIKMALIQKSEDMDSSVNQSNLAVDQSNWGLFWFICCETGKVYTQKVNQRFRITMAVLHPESEEDAPPKTKGRMKAQKFTFDNEGEGSSERNVPGQTSSRTNRQTRQGLSLASSKAVRQKTVLLKMYHDATEYLLCVLKHGEIYQVNLNLIFDKGEAVTFIVFGHGKVCLSGYVRTDSGSDLLNEYWMDSSVDQSNLAVDQSNWGLFWGIWCETGKMYTQKVNQRFRITMAVLHPESEEDAPPKTKGRKKVQKFAFDNEGESSSQRNVPGRTSSRTNRQTRQRLSLASSKAVCQKTVLLKMYRGTTEYLLCVLKHGEIYQVNLNLIFDKGEAVTFIVFGHGKVCLSGYLLTDSESDLLNENGYLCPLVEVKSPKSSTKNKGEGSKTPQMLEEESVEGVQKVLAWMRSPCDDSHAFFPADTQ